jgi:hypothetical protein
MNAAQRVAWLKGNEALLSTPQQLKPLSHETGREGLILLLSELLH